MDCEYKALIANGTWEIVKLPRCKKTINCKWFFKIKLKSDHSLERNKTIVAAQGFYRL